MPIKNLLCIPVKKSDHVNLEDVIRQVISDDFLQSPSSFTSALHIINELRGYLTQPVPTIETISALSRYYVQLTALQLKLPEKSIEFCWYSPEFDDSNSDENSHAGRPYITKSFLFERASILYVIGSLYCQMAIEQNSYTGSGLKKAGIYFQYAAGCFQHMDELELSKKIDSVPLDMTSNFLCSLTYLMLASAQEMCWLKAVTEGLKDRVVSKLSMQTHVYYASAYAYMRHSVGIPSDWTGFCQFKSIHFEAASFYRLATHYLQQEKYGEAICRLQKCMDLVSQAQKIRIDNDQAAQDLANLAKVAGEDLRKYQRENDLIYLQEIPDIGSIEAPQSANLVKPLITTELAHPLDAFTPEYGKPLFEDLIPYNVIQYAAGFKERCINYVDSNFKQPLIELNRKIDTYSVESDLKAQVDAVMRPQSVPSSIHDYQRSIKEIGGISKLDNIVNDLQSLKLKARFELDSNWKLINRSCENDDSARALYGAKRWTLRPLKEEASDLVGSFVQFETYLKDSENGDQTIYSQIQQLRPFLEVFEDDESLEQFIPKADVIVLNPKLQKLISEAQKQSTELSELKSERKTFLSSISNEVDNLDMIPKVMAKYKELSRKEGVTLDEKSFESVSEEAIGNFSEKLDFVMKSTQKQNLLIAKMKKLNLEFIEAKHNLKIPSDREQALSVLGKTYHGYCEVIGNIKQGLAFYNDFLTSLQVKHDELENYLDERRQASAKLEVMLDEMDGRIKHV